MTTTTVTTTTSSSSSSSSSTSTSSSTSVTTTTIAGCPTKLTFHTGTGTTSCGGAAFGPAGSAPFTGAIFNSTTGGNGNGWGGHLIGTNCSFGPLASKSCTRTNVACTVDADCGGTGLCNPDPRCLFGPPLPVPTGPVSTSILNVFRLDASGTADKSAGTSSISIPLSSYVYLTQNTQKYCKNGAPGTDLLGLCTADGDCTGATGSAGACLAKTACPTCANFGTSVNHCVSGKNHRSACTPVGSKTTTTDCLPKDVEFIAPPGVTLAPLGTSLVHPHRPHRHPLPRHRGVHADVRRLR